MVNYHENIYGRRGIDGRGHIPELPFWVAIIRVAQLVFAFLVMILAAVAANYFGSDAEDNIFEGYSMAFFAFAWTLLYLIYIFASPLYFPKFYQYWVHLGLEFLSMLWWLVTFALLADEAKYWNALQRAINAEEGEEAQVAQEAQAAGINFTGFGSTSKAKSAVGCSRGALGLSVINWLLFIVTLVVFSFYLNKHRVANGKQGISSLTRDAEKNQAAAQGPVELQNVPENPHNTMP